MSAQSNEGRREEDFSLLTFVDIPSFICAYLLTFQIASEIDTRMTKFSAQLSLVIEVDGESHFTDECKDYDWERTQILEGYGLKVLRFTNDEVLQDWEGVCRRIEEEIPPTSSPSLRLKKGG